MKIHLILLMFVFVAGCATPRKSRLAATATAVGVGLAVGAATAPSNERTELHAMYWGGILGVLTAVASEYYFSDDNESEKLQLENDKLKAQMDVMKNANTVLLKQGQGYFKGAGEEYFQGGKAKWRLYQIDRWDKDGPNRMYHKDRMVELMPAESSGQ